MLSHLPGRRQEIGAPVMTSVEVKQYLLIDGLNGRTVPVEADQIAYQLWRLGRDLQQANRFQEQFEARGAPLWARYVDATLTRNPAWTPPTEETTQVADMVKQPWEQPELVSVGEGPS